MSDLDTNPVISTYVQAWDTLYEPAATNWQTTYDRGNAARVEHQNSYVARRAGSIEAAKRRLAVLSAYDERCDVMAKQAAALSTLWGKASKAAESRPPRTWAEPVAKLPWTGMQAPVDDAVDRAKVLYAAVRDGQQGVLDSEPDATFAGVASTFFYGLFGVILRLFGPLFGAEVYGVLIPLSYLLPFPLVCWALRERDVRGVPLAGLTLGLGIAVLAIAAIPLGLVSQLAGALFY